MIYNFIIYYNYHLFNMKKPLLNQFKTSHKTNYSLINSIIFGAYFK